MERGWGSCGQIICYHVAAFNLIRYDNILEMSNFDLLTTIGGGGQNICYHVAAFNDHILKKLNFDLLTPTQGSGEVVGVCVQNICYHVAACVIPFNLICNMTML